MEGGGGGGGVLGVLIGGSEPEWEMRRTRWGGSTRCIVHLIHTSYRNSIGKYSVNIPLLTTHNTTHEV